MATVSSKLHEMFGRNRGTVTADDGEVIWLACRRGLVGFAEEHHAKW
jgi:hypothetical protein